MSNNVIFTSYTPFALSLWMIHSHPPPKSSCSPSLNSPSVVFQLSCRPWDGTRSPSSSSSSSSSVVTPSPFKNINFRLYHCSLFSDLFSKTLAAQASSFRFVNNCNTTIWAANLASAGRPPLSRTGFELRQDVPVSLAAPPGWSGRFWARTGCSGGSSGSFKCDTGDCGTGKIECDGAAGAPPATLVEITLANAGAVNDFYDISLVDGFNVGASISRTGCPTSSCITDLNVFCPFELHVTGSDGLTVACMSACEKFGNPIFCCTEEYASPTKCQSTMYSSLFKNLCPNAYTYAYDDPTSTFTCGGSARGGGPEYIVTFCPWSWYLIQSARKESPKVAAVLLLFLFSCNTLGIDILGKYWKTNISLSPQRASNLDPMSVKFKGRSECFNV